MDEGSIKIEREDSCIASTDLHPVQINWLQSSTGEDPKMEHDASVVWERTDWQMSKDQPDTSTKYKEDSPNSSSGSGKRVRTTAGRLTKRAIKWTDDTKLPEILRFFSDIEKVQDYNAKPGAIIATCNACQARIKGFIRVTSNFIKHLRLKHYDMYSAFMNAKQIGTSVRLKHCDMYVLHGKQIDNSEKAVDILHETDSFDDRVLYYIIDTAAPLSTVELSSFRNLFKGTGLNVMNRSKIEVLLEDRFMQMCRSIKNAISESKFVCTTVDVWSTKNCSFFAYTCHWFDLKYHRNSVALACKRISGEYCRILNMINSINAEFNLNNLKIISSVSHGSWNYSEIFENFGINFKNSIENVNDCESVEFKNNFLANHIKCASYTLNCVASIDFLDLLADNKALKDRHTQVFEKCSSLWEKCNCPKSSQIIIAVLGKPLIVPVMTRWNSIYDSICHLLSHKQKLDELFNKLVLHDPCFSACDIQYLEEYRMLMAPLASTIEFLQMDSNLFYGCLLPALTSLCIKLKRISNSTGLVDLKNVAVNLQVKLKSAFSKYFELTEDANVAIIASVLCPSVKMRWFNALKKVSLHKHSVEDIHRIIIAEAVRHARASDNTNQNPREPVFPKQSADFYEFDETDDADETSDLDSSQPAPFTSKLSDDVEAQLHKYLRDSGTSFELLKKYPLLHDLAVKYNTPLHTSVSVERLISIPDIIRYSNSSDLSDYHFEKMLLLKINDSN